MQLQMKLEQSQDVSIHVYSREDQ